VTISSVNLPTGAKATIDRDFVIATISAPSGLKSAGSDDDDAAEDTAADAEGGEE
jgi:large subunit ribosomal protein L25